MSLWGRLWAGGLGRDGRAEAGRKAAPRRQTAQSSELDQSHLGALSFRRPAPPPRSTSSDSRFTGPGQWFPLAMSRDIFGCGGCYRHLVSGGQGECPGQPRVPQQGPAPNANIAKVGDPC